MVWNVYLAPLDAFRSVTLVGWFESAILEEMCLIKSSEQARHHWYLGWSWLILASWKLAAYSGSTVREVIVARCTSFSAGCGSWLHTPEVFPVQVPTWGRFLWQRDVGRSWRKLIHKPLVNPYGWGNPWEVVKSIRMIACIYTYIISLTQTIEKTHAHTHTHLYIHACILIWGA